MERRKAMASKSKTPQPEPKKETAVARKPVDSKLAKRTQELDMAIPEHMRGMAGAGTELMRPEDVEIPRLLLLQAMSPQVVDGDERPNHFWHSVAEQNLGKELTIVPVFVDQSYILWRPRKQGGGMLARAGDGIHWNTVGEFEVQLDNGKKVIWRTAKTVRESKLDQWGSSDPSDPNSPPAATRMYNVVTMLPDFPELSPVVISMQRSAIKVARKFVGKLMISRAPIFGLQFKMSGVKDQNSRGDEFFNYQFLSDGFVQDPEAFEQYKETYEYFKKAGLRIRDMESLQTETETDTPEPAEY